eukprot:ANDGO_05607.mRNA.2 Protein ELC
MSNDQWSWFFSYVRLLEVGNGRYVNVIALTGTIPIDFRGAQYNIPVSIHIPHAYPIQPPIPVVVPTPQMIIKEGHKNVQATGTFVHPYLQNWKGGSSTMFELLTVMASAFSQEPPVYSKPTVAIQQPQQQPPTSYGYPPTATRANTMGNSAAAAAIASTSVNHAAVVSAQPPAQSAHAQYAASVDQKVRVVLQQFQAQMGAEMRALWDQESALGQRSRTASTLQVDLASEISAAEARIRSYEAESGVLAEDIERLEARGEAVDPDQIFVPADFLAQQYYDCLAEDAAYDDLLYYASKAVERGAVTVEQHLKIVRDNATKRFLARALAKKIRSMMMAQQQQPQMQTQQSKQGSFVTV